jgi:hypothetical protein
MMGETKSPWTYFAYENDAPSESFGSLATFIDLWRSKCPGPDRFPRWRQFEPLEFEGWWGQISLAEVCYDPIDLRWVLWGTAITEWWGCDYTNKRVSEISDVADVWENFERGYLERLIDQRLIGFVSGSLAPQRRGYNFINGIDLPLERDGAITHILSAYTKVNPADAFEPDLTPVHSVGVS